MDTKSPVEELFTDSGLIDEEAVVRGLKPYLKIQSESNKVLLSGEGYSLSTNLKILLYGLAKKLLKVADRIERESFSAKEVSKELSIKKGSTDPAFKKLKEGGFIVGVASDYIVSNDKVSAVLKLLGAGKKAIK